MKIIKSPKQSHSNKKSEKDSLFLASDALNSGQKVASSVKQSSRKQVSVNKAQLLDTELESFSAEFESSGESLSDTVTKGISERKPKTEYDRLMHKAVYLLSMREHSVKELEEKLFSRSESPDTVFSVMDFLKEHDYVSDSRFAEAFVRSRANKGHGPVKIRAELRNKGVRIELIDEYLDPNDDLWFDNAQLLHNKKYGDEPVKDYNAWSKRARFLQGRGFTMEHIQTTVPQVDYE